MEAKAVSVQSYRGITAVQFFTSDIDTFDYMPLGKAAEQNFIKLKEINEGGSVNDVFVINSSDKYVFMMDGDIIIGAKQNRIINTSVLLPPKSKSSIHVSCVEQGRWSNGGGSFKPSDYTAPSSMRMNKNKDVFTNLRSGNEHYADQNRVWESVSENLRDMKVESKTDSLDDVIKEKKEEFDLFADKFSISENCNGIALFHGGDFIGLDLFNSSEVYKEYFPKIIKGIIWELTGKWHTAEDTKESEFKYRTLEMIDKIESQEKNKFKGAGVGEEERFDDQALSGFKLNYQNKLIHLAAFKSN
ncbi:MAG: hypothetical protein CVV24_10110 [Ignavibacteriae bacterium HGW-Ignavibacteriae-3]|nr:MAG: hypothetical protein CVV24_10110 [Ignavibacteriae bacterium HGW-Ignavibacteriae-3]